MEDIVDKIDTQRTLKKELISKLFGTFKKYYYYVQRYNIHIPIKKYKIGKRKMWFIPEEDYDYKLKIRKYKTKEYAEVDDIYFIYNIFYDEWDPIEKLDLDYISEIKFILQDIMSIIQNELLHQLDIEQEQVSILKSNYQAYKEEEEWLEDYEKAINNL